MTHFIYKKLFTDPFASYDSFVVVIHLDHIVELVT